MSPVRLIIRQSLQLGTACFTSLLLVAFSLPGYGSGKPSSQGLRIYFVDVEGGQATLFVTPDRQSLLVDTGWPDNDSRDAKRIVAAARDAGLKRIDYVVVTHYHRDHVGGAQQLAALIPVGTFIDHGENRQTDDADTVEGWKAYQQLVRSGRYKHLTVKPGDRIPLRGLETEVVSSDGVLLSNPLPGAGQDNAACKAGNAYPADTTENERSVGLMITFGKLRIADLGDLTRDKELGLVCPQNKLGTVTLYVVSHHGFYESGSPELLHAISPRVAIMDNGARKGGSPAAWDVIRHTPRVEDLWQLHFSEEGGAEHNTATNLIANPAGTDAGHYLEFIGERNGSFQVFNSRTQSSKRYPAR